MYTIVVSHSAEKDLERLPNAILKRVVIAIDGLASEPRPSGCKKLKGEKEQLYRVRIGDYRIIYMIADKIQVVDIRRIRHRKEVYE
ncbi:plasmid stabilization protein [Chitinophagaceae bacterium IBVUCB1]|nr:plasmid stabilization protein [Chitinophagaceae bacterium IBVUCB1]